MIIIIAVLIVILAVFFVRFIIGGPEDSWIKDSRGVWIKHGNPAETTDYVTEQQNTVNCALNLYQQAKNSGMQFSSQCLGTCGNYAVDIVHVPRNSKDNLLENQCADFLSGKVSSFIELDESGEIIRIV